MILRLLVLLLLTSSFVPASPPLPTPLVKLAANWITHPEVSAGDHAVVLFRREFELASVPDSFAIGITADNHFRLYVNGQWVAFGPQLGEITHWRYDQVDLKPYLRAGKNMLAVQVTNWGHNRMFGMQSVHTGLLIQGYGSSDLLTTSGYDGAYRCTIDTAVEEHQVQWRVAEPDIIGGLYANNPTDSLYAGRHPWDWERLDFDDRDWATATFLERTNEVSDGTGFLWMLEPRSTPPQVRRSQPFARLRIAEGADVPSDWHLGNRALTLPANASYRLLLDMNAVTIGFPELRWSGGAGSELKYTWAENLFNADKSKPHRDSVVDKTVKGYFDVVRPDGGDDRRYVPTWYRTFRYLEIMVTTGDEALQLYAPINQRVTSSIPIVAEWHSDDALLDSAIAAGRRTVELCTQDYFLSDAYYETMQYVGDTKVHALVWQALSGDDRHSRNALLDFHRGRNPEGMMKSCYPLRHNFYHSSYSMIFIDMVWDYYERTGDTEFVRQFLPGIRLTLDYLGGHYNAESGFLEGVIYKSFVDWYIGGKKGIAPGSDDDRAVPVTLQYAHALESAGKLAEVLEVTGDGWDERAATVVAGIRECCYVPERKLVAERPSRDFFDQHSTILGVLTGVVPEDDRDEALERVVRDTSLAQATYYFRYYLLEALRREGRDDLAREALQPWYDMVAEGATTQVERFESPSKPTRSEAHPWGAAPALFAYTLLAGIDATDLDGPVTMAPTFGHLQEMRGYYPLLNGEGGIGFELERMGEAGLRAKIEPRGRAVELVWRGQREVIEPGGARTVVFD